MRTKTEKGETVGPARLLEMLEFRFGAFEAIAYAASELADKDSDSCPPMDKATAWAVLEFADDLRQAYTAAVEWSREHGWGLADLVRPRIEEGAPELAAEK